MSIRRLLALAVLALTVPASAGAGVIPDAVPDLPVLGEQAARGSGLVTSFAGYHEPTPKTIDGDISDWTGDITRYAGTAIHSRGEYVYQDYLMDAFGADDGADYARAQHTDAVAAAEPRTYRAEVLAQALGEQFGAGCTQTVCAVAKYGNITDAKVRGEADIEEVRIAASGETLDLLVRTNGMTTADGTGVLVLIDRPEEGAPRTVQAGLTTVAETAFLFNGNGVVSTAGDAIVCVLPCEPSAASNHSGYVNAIEISIPRVHTPEGTRIGVATCVLDDARAACRTVKSGDAKSDIVNVAFRFDEPQRVWMDHDQAFALLHGDIDRYLVGVDFERLATGYSESFEPRPGYWERIYESESATNVEVESNQYFQGRFQHYGVYLPSNFRPGAPLPTTWWTHYRGGHAHDGAAWIPGLLRQFGEDKGNIMIFPSARGTSSWYIGRGHDDFLEVWDDSMAALPIDADRVYMTGYSMGGFASWFLPMVYPDRFAGASPQEGPPTIGLFAGVGPNSADPSNGQQGNDPQATLLYNIVENARHIPYAIYHGTDDELVPISGIVAMQRRFLELGYRNRLYALDGNEHYTTAIIDIWDEAANYLNRFRRDPNPPRVTYRTWPALEYAASTNATNVAGLNLRYRFDKAYWVSGLAVRGVTYPLDTKPATNVWGTIDATSEGRGSIDTLPLPEAGSGLQGVPYQMTGLAHLANGNILPANTFTVTATNLSDATLDVARMGLSTSRVMRGTVTTDGPFRLRLDGSWGGPGPHVLEEGVTESTDASGMVLEFERAGTYRFFIGP